MITDYEHLPLGKYLELLKLAETDGNAVAVVSLLSGRTENELLNMPLTEYRGLADKAGFLFFQPTPSEVRKEYRLGDTRLRLTMKFEKVTTAQYIDFKEYAKAGETDVARYLSVVLVPDGKTYNDGYDVDEVRDLIAGTLPVTDALGIRDFFTDRLGRLIAGSLTSSTRMAMKLTDTRKRRKMLRRLETARAFLQSGDGCGMWTLLRSSRAPLGTGYML